MTVPITGEVIFLFLAVIAAIGGFWWRIEGRLSDQDTARALLQKELAEYKLYVAQNHVSATALREAEQRLSLVMEKLATRLDAIVNRLDELASRRQST